MFFFKSSRTLIFPEFFFELLLIRDLGPKLIGLRIERQIICLEILISVCPEIVLQNIELPTFNHSLVINPQKAYISIDKVCTVSGFPIGGQTLLAKAMASVENEMKKRLGISDYRALGEMVLSRCIGVRDLVIRVGSMDFERKNKLLG